MRIMEHIRKKIRRIGHKIRIKKMIKELKIGIKRSSNLRLHETVIPKLMMNILELSFLEDISYCFLYDSYNKVRDFFKNR